MKQIAAWLVTHLAEMAFFAGACVIAVGAGMIYLPAGLIVGGGMTVAGAAIYMLGAGDGK